MSEDIQKVIEHGEGFLSFGSEKGDRQPTEEGIKLQRSHENFLVARLESADDWKVKVIAWLYLHHPQAPKLANPENQARIDLFAKGNNSSVPELIGEAEKMAAEKGITLRVWQR